MNKFKSFLKRNRFFNGMYYLLRDYFGVSRRKLGYCHKTVQIHPPCRITNPKNVFLYEDTRIDNATLLTRNAKFIMKAHSGSAYGLKVVTGNHAMIVGRLYRSITEREKPEGLDEDVVVEEDVWIGMNVTLASGVHIGRGSILGTGAVVVRDIPPYSIAAGVPARPIKFKWTIDEILEHEAALYPEDQRFTRAQLETIFEETKLKGK